MNPTGQFSREPEVNVFDIHEGADPLKKEATMEVKGNKLLVTRYVWTHIKPNSVQIQLLLNKMCVCVLGAGRRTTGVIRGKAPTSTAGSFTTVGRVSSTATTQTTLSQISTASSRCSALPETSTLCETYWCHLCNYIWYFFFKKKIDS